MADNVNDLKFSGNLSGAMSADLVSDWKLVPDNCNAIGIEVIWSGAPNGTLSLEQKVAGSKTKSLTATVSDNPDGTSYAGDVTAEDPDGEALGSSMISAAPFSNMVRLKYVRTGGSGTCRAKMVTKT